MIHWIHQVADWVSQTIGWSIVFFLALGAIYFFQIWLGDRAARRSK
jgi:hypothetical protein